MIQILSYSSSIQNYSAKQFDDKSKNSSHPNSEATSPAVIHLFEIDVVKMWGKCNDDFYHAVYTAEYGFDEQIERDGRVSLVLKRAIDRCRGEKGHGIRGEGRRKKDLDMIIDYYNIAS